MPKRTTYGERWKILGSLAEGGQAHTFKVRNLADDSTNWVLKRLKNDERAFRFEREIRALDVLDSPHIPKTVDYSIDEPSYYVTEYLGNDLKRYALSNSLGITHALHLFEQVVSAARDAHEISIVHRDIKPNNVVIAPDGTTAYLIDFGICQYSDGELTMLTTDEPFGNAAFAAPECFLGREEEPGPPSDVYSLGKLLYWMVSGGRYINRERLSSAVFERIAANSDLIRFYLMRLIRGTVVEDPAGRWTASRLLEEVHATQRLVCRVTQHESRGEIVLTDGFGDEDSFNPSSTNSARTKDPNYPPNFKVVSMGGPLLDTDIGTAFDVSIDQDVHLEEITLAIVHRAGDDKLDLRIAADLNGKPDSKNTLESFRVSGNGSYSPRIETIQSIQHPVLRQGHRYWILLSVPAPHSEIALYVAPFDWMPGTRFFAERHNSGEWEVREAPGGQGYAVRVTGRPM